MPRLARLSGVCLALMLAAPAIADGPRLAPLRPEIQATDNFVWTIPIRILNETATGVYTDSMVCRVEDTGPGETRSSRFFPLPLSRAITIVPSISAGDSAFVTIQSPALFENAILHLRLHTHDASGLFHVDSTTVVAKPGSTSRRFRSRTIPVRGRQVETVLVPALVERDTLRPAVLLIHGEGSDARHLLPIGWYLANEGYSAMLVSQPGYGLSAGAPDFVGPATMRAVTAAYDLLRRTPGVDSTRVGVWGIGRGATAALLLAGRRKDVKAVISQGGPYDARATFRDASTEARVGFVAEAGRDTAAWRERSPLLLAGAIKAPVLIVHGDEDRAVPVAQAKAMSTRLKESGTAVDWSSQPDVGPLIATQPVSRAHLDFLRKTLRR